MTVKNAPAAIVRAMKQAQLLVREDVAEILADLALSAEPPIRRRAMAYVEDVYAELSGEDRRYLTAKLKELMARLPQAGEVVGVAPDAKEAK